LVRVKLVREYDELKKLADNWDWLLDQFDGGNIFLTWEWLSTWIETYLKPGQLFCLTAYKDDKLVGIAPLWVDREAVAGIIPFRILKFIGSVEACPDHLDFIIRRRNSTMIAEAMWNSLFGEFSKEWHIFEYHGVSMNSKTTNIFHYLADDDYRCLKEEIRGYRICPCLSLPGSMNEFVESMDKRNRTNFRRSEKALAESGEIEFKFVEKRDDLQSAMNGMMEIHNEIWYDEKKETGFRRERFRNFHLKLAERLLERDMLSNCELYHNGKLAGVIYSFKFKGRIFVYIICARRIDINDASIGRALIYRHIERLIEEGMTEYDFLRGDEEYKYYWTNTDRRDLNITFYNRRFASFIELAVRFSLFYLKEIVRSVIGNRQESIRKVIRS